MTHTVVYDSYRSQTNINASVQSQTVITKNVLKPCRLRIKLLFAVELALFPIDAMF